MRVVVRHRLVVIYILGLEEEKEEDRKGPAVVVERVLVTCP